MEPRYSLLGEAALACTHSLSFEAKIRKMYTPVHNRFIFKNIYITQACLRDGFTQYNTAVAVANCACFQKQNSSMPLEVLYTLRISCRNICFCLGNKNNGSKAFPL